MAAVTELISTTDAVTQLNDANVGEDPAIQTYIDASVREVEKRVGAIVQRNLVETYDGGSASIVLSTRPVESITSVVVDGTVLDSSLYSMYGDAGILTLRAGTFSRASAQNVQVSYTVGRDDADPNLHSWKLAGLIILQDLWATRRAGRGGAVPGGANGGDDPLTRANYYLPRRALELLGLVVPGIA